MMMIFGKRLKQEKINKKLRDKIFFLSLSLFLKDENMKIIGISNYNNDYVSDVLIKENVTESEGKKIIEKMNKNDDYYFYKIVPDNYKLYKFEP